MAHVAVQPSASAPLDVERSQTIHRYFDAIAGGATEELEAILMPETVTRWPQTGERITSASSCIRVHTNYPGGPPSHEIVRISGGGDVWTAELVADYGEDRWHIVSLIRFRGQRISEVTDYFGPTLPAPEWRRGLVDPVVGRT